MNLTYIVGVILAVVFMLFGMMTKMDGLQVQFMPDQLGNFFDVSSILITVGCTFAIVVASFPGSMLSSIPRHFKILANTRRFDPHYYIDQLVELAQTARKNGLLSLEEKANEQGDPFFKQAIMLIVDANDPDKVRSILENDIECMSSRHEDTAGMYDKASAVAPAFGMLGTLIGLINMLRNMNLDGGGSSSLGSDMGTALITTLYGVVLANMFFSPIASNLRARDQEEVLCKMIIVEGIMSIQSGENPKFLKEKLMTFMSEQQRENGEGGGKGRSGRKAKKSKGES